MWLQLQRQCLYSVYFYWQRPRLQSEPAFSSYLTHMLLDHVSSTSLNPHTAVGCVFIPHFCSSYPILILRVNKWAQMMSSLSKERQHQCWVQVFLSHAQQNFSHRQATRRSERMILCLLKCMKLATYQKGLAHTQMQGRALRRSISLQVGRYLCRPATSTYKASVARRLGD